MPLKSHTYFIKPVGLHWEIWFRYSDFSIDTSSGASEWREVWGVKFWRKLTAMKVCQDIQRAHNAGYWACIEEGKHE